ncbi:SIMPL domain-containing protein [Microvirga sp. Mcv34]|uniref:SIMPL domain-containing protein n=1 Tax=Microvirga sp. Mcv34 TaxID=2926016 RepID=UPI0021C98138|nr:SIMPL domain-containing protein [Microvirga sp. Mcv34]
MILRSVLVALVSCGSVVPAAAEPISSDGGREPILSVLGRGTYEAKPDVARFRATVATEEKSLEAAMRQHGERAARAAAVLQELRSSGLEIEKSNFRTSENRFLKPVTSEELARGLRPESIIQGYTATTEFHLRTTSLENLNQVVTKLAASALFNLQTVQFNVLQERAALNHARRAAMLDAREQARAYAEPVNLKLGQIVAITDGEARSPEGEADLPARRAGSGGPYSVQIVPPSIVEFTASVNVTWRIGQDGP